MANFDDDATCSVCRRPHRCVFTSGPLEGFCEQCAWNHDTARLELEKRQEAELRRSSVPWVEVDRETAIGHETRLSFSIRVF